MCLLPWIGGGEGIEGDLVQVMSFNYHVILQLLKFENIWSERTKINLAYGEKSCSVIEASLTG